MSQIHSYKDQNISFELNYSVNLFLLRDYLIYDIDL